MDVTAGTRTIAVVVLACLAGLPATSGPWARTKGDVFLAASFDVLADRDVLPLEFRYDRKLYGEVGLGRRLTLGIDLYDSPDDLAGHVFLGRTLTTPDASRQIAVFAGFGRRKDSAGSGDLVVAGASIGTGFATDLGNWWAVAEAQYRHRGGAGDAVKLDLTLGLNPGGKWLAYGQILLADYPETGTTARLQALYVRRLNRRLSVETGLIVGITGDRAAGLRLGLWTEF